MNRKKNRIGQISWSLVYLSVIFVGGASLAGFFDGWWWVFDVLCHFRVQYAWLLAAGLLVLLSGKRYKSAIAVAILAVVNASFVLPLYLPSQAAEQDISTAPALRLLTLNVFRENDQYQRVIELISRTNPDIVVLLELTEKWAAGVEPLTANYPNWRALPRSDSFGLGIYSRYPIEASEVARLQPLETPALVTRLDVAGKQLSLIAGHPPPPKNGKTFAIRQQHLIQLGDLACKCTGPLLLVGDFNTTSWSSCFRALKSQSGLGDSRVGFGVQPSWPTYQPLIGVAIDHCLTSSDIQTVNRQIEANVGSDHFPIVIDFIIQTTAKGKGREQDDGRVVESTLPTRQRFGLTGKHLSGQTAVVQ